MSPSEREAALSRALAKLRRDRNALSWPQRRACAQLLERALQDGSSPKSTLPLLRLLAEDPKWEVRKVAANMLYLVRADDFQRLAASLSQDPSADVQKAAALSLKRRRKAEREARKRPGFREIFEWIESLERRYGKAAAKEVARAGELYYDALVAPVAHDLRNFGDALAGLHDEMRERIKAGKVDAALLQELLDASAARLAHFQRLREDMLEFSHPLPSGLRGELLVSLVAEAQRLVADGMKARGYKASVPRLDKGVPNLLTVEVSRHHIVRALMNIVKNAVEAFPLKKSKATRCRITVDVEALPDGTVRVAVADRGKGMSRTLLEKVRRFTFGNSTKGLEGTGLGLPTAHRFVAAHGGRLEIDSKRGKGTTVTIFLPLEQDA